ncbi:MAG TPA: SHOCT domain-containing protein [Anaerolineales bacterium]|nr:SHOCT domain-containing protein [Anaerolineales bacterium]
MGCHRGWLWGRCGGGTGLLGSLLLLGGAGWLLHRSGALNLEALNLKGGADPLDIARQRLAAGEITPEEFEEIRERLRV